MENDILVVMKEEHHLWRTCPCSVCAEERERQNTSPSLPPSSRKVSLNAAYFLGIIQNRNPHGSLARELMLQSHN